jgi:hypothetical protein
MKLEKAPEKAINRKVSYKVLFKKMNKAPKARSHKSQNKPSGKKIPQDKKGLHT